MLKNYAISTLEIEISKIIPLNIRKPILGQFFIFFIFIKYHE